MTTETTTPIANPDLESRRRLLEGLPVAERRVRANGVDTAVLEGGDGDPILFLHGPGESAAKWLRIVPDLVRTNRVIAPDLPAHGSSVVPPSVLSDEAIDRWLDELIDETCADPPVVVGHVLGGAIAARYTARHPGRVRSLVLVDTLGLARFRPTPGFAFRMMAFLARPSERSFDRFMEYCSNDLDDLRDGLAGQWEAFEAYNVSAVRGPGSRQVSKMLRRLGTPPISRETLEGIDVPITLIWGRHDLGNRLRIAERASERYRWPLLVIEDCADDPARDRPVEFLAALRSTLDGDQSSTT